ncbi:DUF3079 domain-containing protein [Xanthomonas bonasiae]|nr:DUF3079 domain-containing protein [Xanthomonas bonasiae]
MFWIKARAAAGGDTVRRNMQRGRSMAKPFPLQPAHPERICWGCDRYCAAADLACGNGSGRVMHPIELQGEHWYLLWGIEPEPEHPGRAKIGEDRHAHA